MPSFELANELAQTVQIKVIGVGGGGGNAVNRMVKSGVQGAEFIAVNTDKQILSESVATHKIQIGERTTRGMGAGGDPSVGMKAAEESREAITDVLRGADLVFITAGMGGGTGTGAAPIIAEISKEMGILTVGVVTKPFNFEKEQRMNQAVEGIKRLAGCVDSLIVIPNEHLKRLKADGRLPMREAFAMADLVLVEGVRNISELIKTPAFINLDF
ncbi:MAG: cell division protein FtsZ, partial [Oscillospiraceae bacterium]|nr:cell division protein FtsZ [Oscillospiraceae bacterium]